MLQILQEHTGTEGPSRREVRALRGLRVEQGDAAEFGSEGNGSVRCSGHPG